MSNVSKFEKIRRIVYLDRIRPFYHLPYIKVITGIRRCGKSEILKQIILDLLNEGINLNQIITIDLESEQYMDIETSKQIFDILHQKIVNKDMYYIFIDEIQHIHNFEKVIAAIRNSYNCSLFVTGSNSMLLHGKLQDRLTGRAKEFEIRPFVYSEVLEFKKLNKIEIDNNDLEDYIKWGGLPQRFEQPDSYSTSEYLNSLYESIIKKDILSKHKRINKHRFDTISRFIMSNSGKFFSALSLAKSLKNELKHKDSKALSKSINEYANHLIECYLITECPSFDIGLKRQLIGSRKFYPIDTGLKNAMLNLVSFDKTFSLESIIYNELVYRGYKVYYGKKNNCEIDFVVTKENKKCYIQVAFKIEKEETFDREYKPLKMIKDTCPKYVMSLSNIKENYNGISHININDFLTHKEDIYLS